MRCGFLDIVMPAVSGIGNSGTVWILIALIFIAAKKHRITGIAMLTAMLMGLLIGNLTLKPLISRIRPCDINTAVELLIPRPKDYSFPSGHTLSSFAAATVIFLGDRRLGVIAVILAAVIAFSRLYLYVHYPSDILGGIVIGVALGILAHKVIFKIIKISKRRKG